MTSRAIASEAATDGGRHDRRGFGTWASRGAPTSSCRHRGVRWAVGRRRVSRCHPHCGRRQRPGEGWRRSGRHAGARPPHGWCPSVRRRIDQMVDAESGKDQGCSTGRSIRNVPHPDDTDSCRPFYRHRSTGRPRPVSGGPSHRPGSSQASARPSDRYSARTSATISTNSSSPLP